jgi:hypothetical protein
MCLEQGKTTAAVAADHVVPHKGDTYQFYCGKLQSLCLQCHGLKTQADERGYATDIGADGWPLDQGHPVYRIERRDRMEQAYKWCGFCGKSADEVKRIIAGPTNGICNECIELMHGMLDTPSAPEHFTPIEEFRRRHGRA